MVVCHPLSVPGRNKEGCNYDGICRDKVVVYEITCKDRQTLDKLSKTSRTEWKDTMVTSTSYMIPPESRESKRTDSHAKHFAIHVLSDQQKDICEAFAKNGYAFRDIEHGLNTHGVPLIESCIARFECSHVATHPAGDHVIVIGQVNNAQVRTGRPLVFSSGNYGVIEEL